MQSFSGKPKVQPKHELGVLVLLPDQISIY